MKKIYLIIILGIVMMSSTCGGDRDDCHRNIRIINNSDKTIRLFGSYSYPDSISDFGTDVTLYNIDPYSDYFDYSKSCGEASINNRNKYGVLMYFLIDDAVLKSTPMDTIVKYKMYLKKYDLTVESLEKSNWTVTYP